MNAVPSLFDPPLPVRDSDPQSPLRTFTGVDLVCKDCGFDQDTADV